MKLFKLFSITYILVNVLLLKMIKEANSYCTVYINELNINDPQKPEKKEFIELATNCTVYSVPLRGYKLIGISTGTKSSNVATIELVVTLWNSQINKKGFFTIGGTSIEKSDMKVGDPCVKFRQSFTKGIVSMTNFLKNSNTHLHAIGLLYGINEPFKNIVINKTNNYIKIDDEVKDILKNNLVDLVVYGRRTEYDRCNIFEEIYPAFINKKYTLREFDISNGNDHSLNRCTLESNGFLPEKFKIGTTTPGDINDCSGPHFLIEDHILDIVPPVITQEYTSDFPVNEADVGECSSNLEKSDYYRINSKMVDESVEREITIAHQDVCTRSLVYPEGGNTVQEIDHANNRKRRLSPDVDYSETFEWDTEVHFK